MVSLDFLHSEQRRLAARREELIGRKHRLHERMAPLEAALVEAKAGAAALCSTGGVAYKEAAARVNAAATALGPGQAAEAALNAELAKIKAELSRLGRIEAREHDVALPSGEFGFLGPLLEAVYRFLEDHPGYPLSDLERKSLSEAQRRVHGVSRKKQKAHLTPAQTLALVDKIGSESLNPNMETFTYTGQCPSCDGEGGWVDYGRGWDCWSGPEPDEWVPCERCEGTGLLTETYTYEPSLSLPSAGEPPQRSASAEGAARFVGTAHFARDEDDFDDSDPFVEEPTP